jgi:integrase/recombinase XerD
MTRKFKESFQVRSKTHKTVWKWLATILAILLHARANNTGISYGASGRSPTMDLFTSAGGRKYLNSAERHRFEAAAQTMPHEVRLFCLVLLWSGCRISEALAITPMAIDREAKVIALVTLKRRRRHVIRQIPMPPELISELAKTFNLPEREKDPHERTARLWNWNRTTAWRHVKAAMRLAGVSGGAAMPKGLRHGFGVAAFQAVPPHLVQRWLGHASLRTTAIYGDVSGREERLLAKRLWDSW